MKRLTQKTFYLVCLILLLLLSFHYAQGLEKRPLAQIEVAFRSLGDREAGFTAGKNDPQNRRVTDPVAAWHTYLGSASDDYGNAIALDTNGNIYVAG
jgi:hypothetical protein